MKEMIMRMRKEKGGFTLAELLIVVAIVMVLVAIAVPVFTGMLDNANKAVQDGSISSVRTTAAAAIMSEPKAYGIGDATNPTTEWTARADVSSNGQVSNLRIEKGQNGTEEATKQPNGSYAVTVHVTETALPDAPTTTP